MTSYNWGNTVTSIIVHHVLQHPFHVRNVVIQITVALLIVLNVKVINVSNAYRTFITRWGLVCRLIHAINKQLNVRNVIKMEFVWTAKMVFICRRELTSVGDVLLVVQYVILHRTARLVQLHTFQIMEVVWNVYKTVTNVKIRLVVTNAQWTTLRYQDFVSHVLNFALIVWKKIRI